jgi:putative component of membrane protein insertase Oxa1/YidC/SpoIIIJ protein YidD
LQAFSRHGFFAGLILSAYRILRCNPFGKAGYDPVPEKNRLWYRKTNKKTEKNENILREDKIMRN